MHFFLIPLQAFMRACAAMCVCVWVGVGVGVCVCVCVCVMYGEVHDVLTVQDKKLFFSP